MNIDSIKIKSNIVFNFSRITTEFYKRYVNFNKLLGLMIEQYQFLQFKQQKMIECNFCRSGQQDNYVYTECSHLVCLHCASQKWDRKYSFKCCNKTTFLEEETCLTLERLNQVQQRSKKEESKENIPSIAIIQKTQPTASKNVKEDHATKSRDIQKSVYVSQFQQKSQEKQQITYFDSKNEIYLSEVQHIMNESVQRIKFSFQMYRKEIERKEESLLRDVYNRFSEQFAKHTVTQNDTRNFKEKVNKMITDELASLAKIPIKEAEGKPDKILEKLEYNQLKMKEKLNRHYDLLK